MFKVGLNRSESVGAYPLSYLPIENEIILLEDSVNIFQLPNSGLRGMLDLCLSDGLLFRMRIN